ncbi:MAG: hypothetical protein LIQ31_04035 [Planctomycetes bacterium]|nr:hypothetical protein [Planctomycetota bacterium]
MTAIGSALQNTYSTQATFSQTKTKATVDYLQLTGNRYGNAYGDNVEVSATSQELLERARSLDVFSCIFPGNDVRKGAKSLFDVKNDFLADFNDFSSAFGSMSGMLGLSAGDTYTMGLNGTGGMTVGGSDATGAANLSKAFNNADGSTSTMTKRFALMAARAALVDAGATEPGFGDAYKQDPVGAIKDNIDALKDRLLGFRTVSSGGEMAYGFMRKAEVEMSEEKVTITTTKTSDEADSLAEAV